MKVMRLSLSRFRGFEQATLHPREHVVLLGEPGAGRSTVIEALRRTLHPESLRGTPSDLDLYERDYEHPAEVEVVLGELGSALEQIFWEQLEVWHRDRGDIEHALTDPSRLDRDEYDFVVRITYRIEWDDDEAQLTHRVYYPKLSDPSAQDFVAVPRRSRTELPFGVVQPGGRQFDVRPRATFRRLLDNDPEESFAATVDALLGKLREVLDEFSSSESIQRATNAVLHYAAGPLGLRHELPTSIRERLRFLLSDDQANDLLKVLAPAMTLRSEALPLPRHGSGLESLLAVAEALASLDVGEEGIGIVDDFGGGLDHSTAQYLAAVLRRALGQVWLSSRQGMVADCFAPGEIVRLAFNDQGARRAHADKPPVSKAERLVARYRNRTLFPAMASRALVVVEGPHDRISYMAVANRLAAAGYENAYPPAHRIQFVDAGSEGGTGTVPKLADVARELGFRIVVLVDHDGESEQAEKEQAKFLGSADAVVQLPDNHAVEKALLAGVSDDDMHAALQELYKISPEFVPDRLFGSTGKKLKNGVARKVLKNGNLHAHFVDALPDGVFPPLAVEAIQTAVSVALDSERQGLIRLDAPE